MRNFLYRIPRRTFIIGQHKAELPKLDYDYTDLEPVLPEVIVRIHHTKHHQTYIDNYNKQLGELNTAISNNDLEKIVSLTKDIKFNGGSHINHSLYWKNLAPVKNGGGQIPGKDSALVQHINHVWGSTDNFISDFIDKLLKIQGSGWGNLTYCKKTKALSYLETKDQDPVCLIPDRVPILTVDAWEHAWYPKYLNDKKKYYTEIWKIINWKDLEQRYNNVVKH